MPVPAPGNILKGTTAGIGLLRIHLCLLVIGLLFSGGCVKGPGVLPDLTRYPQEASRYVGTEKDRLLLLPAEDRSGRAEDFIQKYFLPWRVEEPIFPREVLFWPLSGWDTPLFGENTLPRSREWLAGLKARARPDAFPSLNERGITLANIDLRAMPTQKPAFYDFERAGEGFPFDYFQNSTLWANTPVHIIHASRDGGWLLVETGWVFGWVRTRDIGLVDPGFRSAFEQRAMIAFLRDGVPVIDTTGNYRFSGRVGGLLPLAGRRNGRAEVLVAAADHRQQAVLTRASLPPRTWAEFPLAPTVDNLAGTAGVFLGQTYGWGGLYKNRDCSAMIRDFFTPFGVWLPRNSSQQAGQGKIIPLGDLSPGQKKRVILDKGVPFLTLIWMPGHIMLYIGSSRGEPLVMHSLWGLRTQHCLQGEGRYVLGRTVITSLTPEKGLPFFMRSGTSLLQRVQGMSLLDPLF